jgi:tetratricopeptide (TPR) repeat protein
MRSLLVWLSAALLFVAAGPANAAWYKSNSKHFIIYADQNPKVLADFASRLERFDQAVRALLKMDDPAVGDGNRVTVYVLPTDADVRKLIGDTTGFIFGFYTGRATGSLVYIGKRNGPDGSLGADAILYHEYSHHLMMQQLDRPYPEWFVEGFAEYLSAPIFEHDGAVGIGAPPQDRDWSLLEQKSLPADVVLGETYGDITKLPKEQRTLLYERGWLLVHYLYMEPKRAGQLQHYFHSIAGGTPPLAAAQAAFGDLSQLEKELKAYRQRDTLAYFKIPAALTIPAPVDVQPLGAGASQIILLRGTLKYGVGPSETEALAAKVRQVEAQFPGEELVESTLSEAELKSGHVDAAEAAADRALKINPRNTEAMVLKGDAIVARGKEQDGPQRHALFEQARQIYIGANKLDTEDPEPLFEYYQSYMHERVRPTANAIAAMHYASDLAPQDVGLRMNSAIAYLNEGKFDEARMTLNVVAYSPHSGSAAEMARRMIADIDAGKGSAALAELRTAATAPPSSH